MNRGMLCWLENWIIYTDEIFCGFIHSKCLRLRRAFAKKVVFWNWFKDFFQLLTVWTLITYISITKCSVWNWMSRKFFTPLCSMHSVQSESAFSILQTARRQIFPQCYVQNCLRCDENVRSHSVVWIVC